MFGRFTYLGYDLLFTVPLIIFLFLRGHDALRKHIFVVAITTILLTLYGSFIWPRGLQTGTWRYNPEKMLGVLIFGVHGEDILWWFLTTLLYASFIAVSSAHEQDGHSFLWDEVRGCGMGFRYACSGLRCFFRERSYALMACFAAAAIIAVIFSKLILWAALIFFVISAVFACEMINSALESFMDAVKPEQHPLVKRAKDTAAAASLVIGCGAFLVGVLFLYILFSGE